MHCIGLFYRCPALCTHIPFNNHLKLLIFIYILTFVCWHFAGKYCGKNKATADWIFTVWPYFPFFCTHCAFGGHFGLVVAHEWEVGVAQCRSFYKFSFIKKVYTYDRSNKDIDRQFREYKHCGICMLVPVSYLFRHYNQLSKSHA